MKKREWENSDSEGYTRIDQKLVFKIYQVNMAQKWVNMKSWQKLLKEVNYLQ